MSTTFLGHHWAIKVPRMPTVPVPTPPAGQAIHDGFGVRQS